MFTGKCSRCEVLKADYEEAPVPTDLLLCKLCHRDVSRKAMTDHKIELIIEELMSIIKQPNF